MDKLTDEDIALLRRACDKYYWSRQWYYRIGACQGVAELMKDVRIPAIAYNAIRDEKVLVDKLMEKLREA